MFEERGEAGIPALNRSVHARGVAKVFEVRSEWHPCCTGPHKWGHLLMWLRRLASNASDPKGIHVGKDGWLFLTRGSNHVVRQYRRSLRMRRVLQDWQELIEERTKRCRRLGCNFLQVVVPEKLTVMPDSCSRPLVNVSLSPAIRLAERMRKSHYCDNYLDLVAPLIARRDEVLYHRTDTHWNYKGAVIAAEHVGNKLGAHVPDDLRHRPFEDVELLLDLGRKLIPPKREIIRSHTTSKFATQTSVNELVAVIREGWEGGPVGIGCQATYENRFESADPRRVVLFGDSCSNFDPIALTGLLAEMFSRVHFVWSTSIDWKIVEDIKPDLLISEIAERFLVKVPEDNFDLTSVVKDRMDLYRSEQRLDVQS